jgi:hypothetical protein
MRRLPLTVLWIATVLALPFALVAWHGFFAPDENGVMASGTRVGLDFVNFWSAGRLALEGLVTQGYDPASYKTLLVTWFAPATAFTNLSYPPSLLPWLAPFALLPFSVAYALWIVMGAVAFLWAALGRWPTRQDVPLVGVLLLAPAVVSNVIFGQIALFMAALFIGALRVLPTRPILAGVMFGFLTLKPQIAVLLPLFLIAFGAWRSLAAMTITALALVLFSIALFGIEPWQAYFIDTAQLQWSYILAMDDFYAIHMTTPYAALWSLGASTQVALAGQWLISAAIVATTFAVARSDATLPVKSLILTLGTMMVVPYALAHDLAVPLAALIWYWRARRDAPSPIELTLGGLLWLLPFPLTFVLQHQGIPATQLMMLGLYGWLVATALGWQPFERRDNSADPVIIWTRARA